MISLLLIGVCVYFFIKFVIDLTNHGFPFGPEQWMLAAICVIFLPVIFFLVKRSIKEFKDSKTRLAEEEEKRREALAKRKREIYLGDDYEESEEPSASFGELNEEEQEAAEDALAEIEEIEKEISDNESQYDS